MVRAEPLGADPRTAWCNLVATRHGAGPRRAWSFAETPCITSSVVVADVAAEQAADDLFDFWLLDRQVVDLERLQQPCGRSSREIARMAGT